MFRLLLYPGLADPGVRFDGVVFDKPTLKDTYCEFGDTEFGSSAPACLEGFLTQAPGFPTSEYRFELQVETKDLATGTLFLYFDAYPQTVNVRHNVFCRSSEDVTVSQSPLGATSWTTAGSVSLTCREYVYVQTPGKKAPPKSYFDDRMIATTSRNFDFEIVWTK